MDDLGVPRSKSDKKNKKINQDGRTFLAPRRGRALLDGPWPQELGRHTVADSRGGFSGPPRRRAPQRLRL